MILLFLLVSFYILVDAASCFKLNTQLKRLAEYKFKQTEATNSLFSLIKAASFGQKDAQILEMMLYLKEEDSAEFKLVGSIPYIVIVDNYRMISTSRLEGKKKSPTVVKDSTQFTSIIKDIIAKNSAGDEESKKKVLNRIYFSIRTPYTRIFSYAANTIIEEKTDEETGAIIKKTYCDLKFTQKKFDEADTTDIYDENYDLATTLNQMETLKYPLFKIDTATGNVYQKIKYSFVQKLKAGVPESSELGKRVDGECPQNPYTREQLIAFLREAYASTETEMGVYFDHRFGCKDCYDTSKKQYSQACIKPFGSEVDVGCAENNFTCLTTVDKCIDEKVLPLMIELGWTGKDKSNVPLKSEGSMSYHYQAYSGQDALQKAFAVFT